MESVIYRGQLLVLSGRMYMLMLIFSYCLSITALMIQFLSMLSSLSRHHYRSHLVKDHPFQIFRLYHHNPTKMAANQEKYIMKATFLHGLQVYQANNAAVMKFKCFLYISIYYFNYSFKATTFF